MEASLPDAEAAVERSQQAVTEKAATRDRAAQKVREDASGKNAAKNAANLKNAEESLSVKREKARTATEHVAYVLAKAENDKYMCPAEAVKYGLADMVRARKPRPLPVKPRATEPAGDATDDVTVVEAPALMVRGTPAAPAAS